jgi:general nucleoside transport system permease protein
MATVEKSETRTVKWLGDWSKTRQTIFQALLSILLSIFIGALLLIANGRNPLEAYQSLLYGAFGTMDRFTETLVKTTPLLLIAVSVSISFKCKFWNIGAEGQFLVGAIFAAWIGLTFVQLPTIILLPLTCLAGAVGGALWSLIAGLLKAYLQANEVITTTMLNYIAVYFLSFLVHGPLMDGTWPQSPTLARSLILPRIVEGTRLNIAFVIAILAILLALVFWRSVLGHRVKIVGTNQHVARAIGLSVPRTILLVAAISGALVGIAGWGDVFGLHFRLIEQIAAGLGSLGIVVALLGQLHPIGMLFSAFFFGALVVGGNAMERNAGVPFALVEVIQGSVILLILTRSYFFARKKEKHEL